MMHILCRLGIHQWGKWADNARGDEGVRQTHECLRCGIKERRVIWTTLEADLLEPIIRRAE